MIRINRRVLIYMLLFIPFLLPASYLIPNNIYRVLKIYRMLVCIGSILYYIRQRATKQYIVFFLCIGMILFVTLLQGGTFRGQLYKSISIIGFMTFFEMGIRKDTKCFMQGILMYAIPISILTCLTMFIYYQPGNYAGGMRVAGEIAYAERKISGNWYLLGLDNSSFFYIFPVLTILILYQMLYKRKVGVATYLLYIFVIGAFVYVQSATASVCFMLGFVLMVLCNTYSLKKIAEMITYKKAILVVVAFAIVIVIFRLQYLFASFITALNKSLTLTRRTVIWDTAIQLIKKNPIWGYGVRSDEYNYTLFGINHVHNIVLQLLYEGGIIATVLFTWAVTLFGRKITKKEYKQSPIAALIAGSIAIYFLNTCLDFYLYVFIPYLLFILADHIDYFVNVYNTK